ncbi:MAG: hypothetical protein V1921_03895 [Candidatus Altiarchaeota archaeon]
MRTKAKGFCRVYDRKPVECEEAECPIAAIEPKELEKPGRCRLGCIECCLGVNVIYDESSNTFVLDSEGKGPCQQLEIEKGPEWLLEKAASRGVSDVDAFDVVLSREERAEREAKLGRALSSLNESDREFIVDVFGLGGKRAKSLEDMSKESAIPLKDLEKRKESVVGEMRKFFPK